MANAIKIIRNGTKKWLKENDVEHIDTIKNIARNSGYQILERREGESRFVRFRMNLIPTVFVTSEKDVKFLCISDLHISSTLINKKKIRCVLNKATKMGVKYVFISGDLCEGIKMGRCHENFITTSSSEQQANEVVEILKDFNFKYFAISGNHDLSFELEEQENPLLIIERKMKEMGRFFRFIPSFCASLIVSDFAIKLVHIDSSFAHCNSKEPCIQYFERVILKRPLEIMHTGKRYPLKIVQIGHMHSNFLKEYKLGKLNFYILQPGSTKDDRTKKWSGDHIGFVCDYSNGKFGFTPL